MRREFPSRRFDKPREVFRQEKSAYDEALSAAATEPMDSPDEVQYPLLYEESLNFFKSIRSSNTRDSLSRLRGWMLVAKYYDLIPETCRLYIVLLERLSKAVVNRLRLSEDIETDEDLQDSVRSISKYRIPKWDLWVLSNKFQLNKVFQYEDKDRSANHIGCATRIMLAAACVKHKLNHDPDRLHVFVGLLTSIRHKASHESISEASLLDTVRSFHAPLVDRNMEFLNTYRFIDQYDDFLLNLAIAQDRRDYFTIRLTRDIPESFDTQ